MYKLKRDFPAGHRKFALNKTLLCVCVQLSVAMTALALTHTGAAVELPVVCVNIKFCFSALLWEPGLSSQPESLWSDMI